MASFPPGLSEMKAALMNFSNTPSSSLTAILRAWKVLVATLIFPFLASLGRAYSTIAANCVVVWIDSCFLVSTIFLAILLANLSCE